MNIISTLWIHLMDIYISLHSHRPESFLAAASDNNFDDGHEYKSCSDKYASQTV
jgi:hypothetical protein